MCWQRQGERQRQRQRQRQRPACDARMHTSAWNERCENVRECPQDVHRDQPLTLSDRTHPSMDDQRTFVNENEDGRDEEYWDEVQAEGEKELEEERAANRGGGALSKPEPKPHNQARTHTHTHICTCTCT
jgi:hypothetical protein